MAKGEGGTSDEWKQGGSTTSCHMNWWGQQQAGCGKNRGCLSQGFAVICRKARGRRLVRRLGPRHVEQQQRQRPAGEREGAARLSSR